MEEIRNSGSFIAHGNFKTGLDIAVEKNIDTEQEVRAIKAFTNTESIFTQPEVDNTIADAQENLVGTVQAVKTIQANRLEIKKPEVFQGSNGSTTTTTPNLRLLNRQWNKIRGISVDILKLLNDCGALSTIEIANRLDKYPKYVTKYMYRLRNYCLITLNQENWKWYITATDDIIIYIIYKEDRKKTERRQKEDRNDNVSSFYNNKKMITEEKKDRIFQEIKKKFSSLEVVVVLFLTNHFHETSNKFVLCTSHDEFAEMLNIPFPESTEIPKTLIKLESDGVIYNFYIREKVCWKIGLKDAFINRI